jgi:Tol biopolymer transport system component
VRYDLIVGRFVLACLIVTGCGFKPAARGDGGIVGDDGGDADADGMTIGADADGSIISATCFAKWFDGSIRFNNPVRLAALDDPAAYERDPSLLADEKTIFFNSNRAGSQGGSDVWTATRTSVTQDFGSPSVFDAASSTNGAEGKMSMTEDQLAFVVASSRTPSHGTGTDMWMATRTATNMPWPVPTQAHLDAVNTNDGQEDPVISGDLLRLYLAPTNANPQHIVRTTRANTGMDFPAPTVIAELDSNMGEGDPALADGERIIVFTSGRSGGSGGGDLWYSTRAQITNTWSAPKVVPDVNGGGNDGDAWVSTNGCRLYFASDTLGQNYTLWQAVAH